MPTQCDLLLKIIFYNIGNLICVYTVILVHCSVTNMYNIILSYFIILCYNIK